MNREEVVHIAEISKLEFTDEELDTFAVDFSDTMDLIDRIKNIDTSKVKATFHVNDTVNNFREDVVEKSLPPEEALKNTPSKKYGYFEIIRFVE